MEGTFDQLGQMQQFIGQKQQEAEGAKRREASMEKEIIQSIDMEKEYYTIKSQLSSTTAALHDINEQLTDNANIYKDLAKATARIAELESSIDISTEEKEFLAYELEKLRKQNERFQQGLDT